MAQESPIARLKDGKVRCLECLGEHPSKVNENVDSGAPLYLVNLLPYKQNCHQCGKVLSYGQTDSWCELFPLTAPNPFFYYPNGDPIPSTNG